MDSISQFGSIIIQAFQKIPGVQELFFNDPQSFQTWSLISGILTIIIYILGFGILILGIAQFCIKKVQNEKNGVSNKSPASFLIGGLVGGLILILLPSIILIIGKVLGSIATTG